MRENTVGSNGLTPAETHPLEKLAQLSPLHMEESVLRYGREMSEADLNGFLAPFAKSNAVLDETFVFKGKLHRGMQRLDDDGNCIYYLDGQYSFALGYLRGKKQRPLWVAVTSFATDEIASSYKESLVSSGVETDYNSILPLIVQIQGAADWSFENKAMHRDAKKVLNKLRWEKALIALLLNWAEKNRVPAVYLLPSSMNRHRYNEDCTGRLHMRYDVTARRMGFVQDGKGFYKKVVEPISVNGQ